MQTKPLLAIIALCTAIIAAVQVAPYVSSAWEQHRIAGEAVAKRSLPLVCTAHNVKTGERGPVYSVDACELVEHFEGFSVIWEPGYPK
jgi:hypothetical protein